MDNEYLKTEMLNTGGGCEVRIVHLNDNKVLVMNDEYVSLYNSIEDFWDIDEDVEKEQTNKQLFGFWVDKY